MKASGIASEGVIVDRDAVAIGELYAQARSSIAELVRCQIECGQRLVAKKASLAHGEWLPWLADNAAVLGFETRRTAARLMQLAEQNGSSTSHLQPAEAIRMSRQTWGNEPRGTTGTGENEWYTPAEHVDLARSVLGDIDLDPASNPKANEIVKARQFFAQDDDGLTRDWHGRVYLNPPYAQPMISYFADKMVEEVTAGNVTQAIMLTHNYTDTAWFQKLASVASAICFTRGRVKFYSPSGEIAAPTQGQAFFYFGGNVERFKAAFEPIGFVT